MIPKVPKLLLQQSVVITKRKLREDGTPDFDQFRSPLFEDESTELRNVRVEEVVRFSGSSNDRKITKSLTLFVYPDYQPEDFALDETMMSAKITDEEQRDYIVKSFKSNKLAKSVFSYELELSDGGY